MKIAFVAYKTEVQYNSVGLHNNINDDIMNRLNKLVKLMSGQDYNTCKTNPSLMP
jgi:hypothetical protein